MNNEALVNYKVINEGGAAIDQEVNGVRDTRNLGLGAIIALNPDNEQTILMVENGTLAPVGSAAADAVTAPAADTTTTVQNGVLTDTPDGTPADSEPVKDTLEAPTVPAADPATVPAPAVDETAQ